MKQSAFWKRQDVPFVKIVFIKANKQIYKSYGRSDQLLLAPPLSYMITHKGVVPAISQCDLTDWLFH